MSNKIIPIDLPKDLSHLMAAYNDNLKNIVNEKIEKAMAEGLWDEPVDMLIDPNNLELVAYYLQKTRKPIRKPRGGFGLNEHFNLFKKKDFSFINQGQNIIKSYRVSALGDLMKAKYVEQSKGKLFEHIDDLVFGADISYANLESTLSKDKPRAVENNEAGETPHINITKNQYDALISHKDKKFNVLQIANNHIMDCGYEGAQITMEALENDKIQYLGVYKNEENIDDVIYTDVDDIKIGWVAHTFSLNGKSLPEGKEWMVDLTLFHGEKEPEFSRIEYQIKKAKEEGCDLVFVTLHWGLEFELYPHPDQLRWAYMIAEMGADAIIGHHSHVAQPYEVFTPERDRTVKVPIFYSLGNATPLFGSSETAASLLASINIAKIEEFGREKVIISGMEVTPIIFMGGIDGDQKYSTLIPVNKLESMDIDKETEAYINDAKGYLELITGKL